MPASVSVESGKSLTVTVWSSEAVCFGDCDMVAGWLYSVLLLHINAVGFQCRRAGMLCYAGV